MNKPPHSDKRALVRQRSRARRLAMQGLYQWQLTGQDVRDIMSQLRENDEYASVDPDYFSMLMNTVAAERDELDRLIGGAVDRPVEQLDPVERAILWCAVAELKTRLDVPTNVAINEAVELAKRFGAQDGYKYVNAVLDAVADGVRQDR